MSMISTYLPYTFHQMFAVHIELFPQETILISIKIEPLISTLTCITYILVL